MNAVDFLAQLNEAEQAKLVNAITSGLHDTHQARRCLTDPTPQAETVRQLCSYVRHAIDRLEVAREVLRQRA